jgi:hypothetical protein
MTLEGLRDRRVESADELVVLLKAEHRAGHALSRMYVNEDNNVAGYRDWWASRHACGCEQKRKQL